MFVLSQSERKFPYLNIGRRMEMFSVKLHDGSWHRCGFGYIRACVWCSHQFMIHMFTEMWADRKTRKYSKFNVRMRKAN